MRQAGAPDVTNLLQCLMFIIQPLINYKQIQQGSIISKKEFKNLKV